MLNIYFFLKIIGHVASQLSKDFCTYEVTSLEISGDRSIVNGNSMPIAATDK